MLGSAIHWASVPEVETNGRACLWVPQILVLGLNWCFLYCSLLYCSHNRLCPNYQTRPKAFPKAHAIKYQKRHWHFITVETATVKKRVRSIVKTQQNLMRSSNKKKRIMINYYFLLINTLYFLLLSLLFDTCNHKPYIHWLHYSCHQIFSINF